MKVLWYFLLSIAYVTLAVRFATGTESSLDRGLIILIISISALVSIIKFLDAVAEDMK